MSQRKEIKRMEKVTEKAVTQMPDSDKPAYLRELEKQGPIRSSDNFDNTDIALPRVKLLQGLSDECETFNEAKPGLFWHTGYDKPLGSEVDFVPVSRRKRYLLVAPLEDGQGILARSDDFINWIPPNGQFEVRMKGRKEAVTWKLAPTVAASGLDKWGTYNPDDPNSPPAATLFYEYLVLLVANLELGPVVLSLTRSQIKRARKGLNDKIHLHEGAGRPMQSLIFRAKSFKDTSPEGEFFNFQFTSNGFVKSVDLYKNAMELKDVLTSYRVQDEETAAHGQGETSTTETKDF